MLQKDYILRMIEMLGDMLRAFFGLIEKGKLDAAEDNLEKIYYDMLRQDAAFFRNIPPEELTTKLLEEHNYTGGHLEILAELFRAEAELEYARGRKEECVEFSRKSLLLFEFIDQETKTFSPNRFGKMEELKKRIVNM